MAAISTALASLTNLIEKRKNPFVDTIMNINPASQYCVFFVRDAGFNVFRKCRDIVVKAKYRHGWELLGRDEAITFEGMMYSPGIQ